MKTFALAAVLLGMVADLASAQTCAAPGGPFTPPGAPLPSASGDTCAGGAIDEFGAVCGGGIISGGPSDVYQMNIGSPNAFTITVTPSGGYDTAIYFVGPGACAQTTGCPPGGDADNGGPNVSEAMTLSGIPAGTYFIVVDSTNLGGTAPACGPYTLSWVGPIPVTLRNFSVD